MSQPCLPEGITFTTQAQIDSFQINYPGCTEIEGDVVIEGSNIDNLSGLSLLTTIDGFLQIGDYDINNYSLQDLSGLDSLTYIGSHLVIVRMQKLKDLSGLSGITSIFGNLDILVNDSLENLTGIENITNVGGSFHIWYNDNFASLTGLQSLICIEGRLQIVSSKIMNCTGLENLVSIGGDFSLIWNELKNFDGLISLDSIHGSLSLDGNIFLNSLSGLDSLTFIGGNLGIVGSDSLNNLLGLQNLLSIGGGLYLHANDNLSNLSGLDSINPNSISDLAIFDNPILTTCEIQSVCEYLVNPNGVINIHDNAAGCNSQEEVEEACESVSVNEFQIALECIASPNPFTSTTTLSYTLDKPGNVQFTVYNVQSQIVFMVQEQQDKGEQQVQWNAEGLPAGMYYFRIQAGDHYGSGKMIKMD